MNEATAAETGLDHTARVARWTMRLTIFWAAFVHAHYVGIHAYGVGVLVSVILELLATTARKRRAQAALVAYALLCAWILLGFGIVSGFWNHAMKLLVAALHGGAVPAALAGLFKMPGVGGVALEIGGCLTFVSACVAAPAVWRHVVALRALRRSNPVLGDSTRCEAA